MKTEVDLADILLPGAVKAAIKLTSSPDARTRALAWEMVHRYLASPVAMAATMQADDPQVVALHAELLQWSSENLTSSATGNASAKHQDKETINMGIKKTGKVKPLKLTTAAPGPKARAASKPVTLGKTVAPILKAPAAKPRGS